ncbi:hypothetical protein D9X91_14950 [Falsibacillus albus]|uniref:Uncharacterized protein n=1 Tax=Falsibacillus albus TaxID=2478915 RepID=A0A3L7JU25_9BACI|nr:hypothetical protein D9X91_14950 [Falsibacillus albus]
MKKASELRKELFLQGCCDGISRYSDRVSQFTFAVPEEVDLVTDRQTEVVPRSENSRPQDENLGGGSFFIWLQINSLNNEVIRCIGHLKWQGN